jgi:IclR family pca regulon transcriptional regulator
MEADVTEGLGDRAVVNPSVVDDGPAAPGINGSVQSFVRGLAVIRSFDADNPVMTLTEVARRTDLSRATARRFLHTLAELGYVRTDGKSFALTAKVLELGYSYLSSLTLTDIAQPHLERLSASVGESTSASVLSDTDIVYVARVHAKRIINVAITIGTRFPAYATSMGRVLLAALPPAEAVERLAATQLRARTSRSLHTVDELSRQLDIVRAQGWALTDQELEPGLRSLAMPIVDARGRTIAAINVSGHAADGDADAFVARVRQPLADTAADICRELQRSAPISTLLTSG